MRNPRRQAFSDALAWIDYRIRVCRAEEERYEPTSRAAATERSARMELELAAREIAALAVMPRRDRAYREKLKRWETYRTPTEGDRV